MLFASLLLAIGLCLMNYATRIPADDKNLPFVSSFVFAHRLDLANSVLVLGLATALVDFFVKHVLEGRYESQRMIEKLLASYSKALFDSQTMSNRLTLFKRTRGWSAFLWGLGKQKIFPMRENWHAFRALFTINMNADYLRVYLRPARSWNRASTAAFRISDDPNMCEGVAGLIWSQNSVVKICDLPTLQSTQLFGLKKLNDLAPDDNVRKYAEATNVTKPHLLLARKRFARHFVGTVIENSAGERWGVLLLDSDDENCPLAAGSSTTEYQKRFEDCALILGKLVE
jgi:hypothetical protein